MLPPVTVSSSSLESSRISESMSVSCLSLRKGGFPLARDNLLQAFHSSSVMQITERGVCCLNQFSASSVSRASPICDARDQKTLRGEATHRLRPRLLRANTSPPNSPPPH